MLECEYPERPPSRQPLRPCHQRPPRLSAVLQAASKQQNALHLSRALTARKYSAAAPQCDATTASEIEAVSGRHEMLRGLGLFVRPELPLAGSPHAHPRAKVRASSSRKARSRFSANTSALSRLAGFDPINAARTLRSEPARCDIPFALFRDLATVIRCFEERFALETRTRADGRGGVASASSCCLRSHSRSLANTRERLTTEPNSQAATKPSSMEAARGARRGGAAELAAN